MLPQNTLSVVYRHADARTKARLRAVSRAAYRDPLMPAPLRRGYAFGTGTRQRDYNQLAKRIDTLIKRCDLGALDTGRGSLYTEPVWTMYTHTQELDTLRSLVLAAKADYRKAAEAVRATGPLYRLVPALRGRATVPREQFMDAVLEHAARETRRHEAALARCPTLADAALAREKAGLRAETKRSKGVEYESDEFLREHRHAQKLARRAARRLS